MQPPPSSPPPNIGYLSATFWIEAGRVLMRSTYDPAFVLELKEQVGGRNRRWDPATKCWSFYLIVMDEVVALAEKHGYAVTVVEPPAPPTPALLVGEDPYSVLLRLAPDETVRKVYRLVASALHPDLGGDTEKMAQANAAWDAIRRDRRIA